MINVYKKTKKLREREEGDKLLLFNTQTKELAILEGMGKAVWKLLSEMSVQEIESKLLEFHPEEQEKVKTYLSQFIEDLVEKSFLVKQKSS